ncbi:MAG: oxidoreductase, coenzyme F420-dependent [Gemmataceae bacterium]|nr:oxidoreductase, coenzyme F420-dependent [Gemmataceae bacterium]
MNIAVIGMGNVGGTLGKRWAANGHAVTFGSRRPADPKPRAEAAASKCGIDTIAGAAAGAAVVVLATPWPAVRAALAAAGDLTGKVLLDCTNPLTPDFSRLELGHTTSGGEEVAKLAPGARVVKICNTTGANNMENPDYAGAPATMLYAGDDPAAKATAAALAKELGFDPIDFGPLAGAQLLEPLALVWITLAFNRLGRDFVLNVGRRPGA